jgi:hypothetical protein
MDPLNAATEMLKKDNDVMIKTLKKDFRTVED